AGLFKKNAIAHLTDFFQEDGSSRAIRMFDLKHEFPAAWERFLKPGDPTADNVFAFDMVPELFPMRDAGKMLKVNSLSLLRRCSGGAGYKVVPTPPAPDPFPDASTDMTLGTLAQYGSLLYSRKDVADQSTPIEIDPAADPVSWSLKMTRPGGGKLKADPSGAM